MVNGISYRGSEVHTEYQGQETVALLIGCRLSLLEMIHSAAD